MATKGASNHYGGARGGRQGKATSHIGYAWAKDFNKKTLAQHFRDHGQQMGCNSKESYAAHAVSFANNVDRVNCVSFIDKHGSTYKYNKATNTLAVITSDGYVITYYKPKDGYDYYKKQKKGETEKTMKLEDYKPMLCPVCGEFFFSELQDDDELPVWCYHCGWMYDKAQHDNPDMRTGENEMSLNEYKKDYLAKIAENPNYDYSEEHRTPDEPHLCPVCGRYEFSDKGSFDICVYCGWEDDSIQLEDPDYDGGANTLSLNQYREEYQRKISENPSYRWDKNE